jgi:hypothetical protein
MGEGVINHFPLPWGKMKGGNFLKHIKVIAENLKYYIFS